MRGLSKPLNLATLRVAQVVNNNPTEISALAKYAQAPTFAPTSLKTKAFYAILLFFWLMNKKEFKKLLKKTWHFIWEDNSIWSWIVNIILAFILIKFAVYHGLGLILSTSHPVVAVVSSSMDHDMDFEAWWEENKEWYMENGINKEDFETSSFRNGFNKGDIMVLVGKDAENI